MATATWSVTSACGSTRSYGVLSRKSSHDEKVAAINNAASGYMSFFIGNPGLEVERKADIEGAGRGEARIVDTVDAHFGVETLVACDCCHVFA